MPGAYYNELDPKAAAWLRELIKQGHIADGVVDERSIIDVRPDELTGFTQCHFFAGIGVWSSALRLAGWPDDRPVWTGSCPCQPFSIAGKGAGFSDERHLWPAWHWLIHQCHPSAVFGEQVASKDGLAWLDLVLADLEGSDYSGAPVDLCAAGLGAPHIRQRLWFVAHSNRERHVGEWLLLRAEAEGRERTEEVLEAPRRATPGELGDANCKGLARRSRQPADDGPGQSAVERAGCEPSRLGHPSRSGTRGNCGAVLGAEAEGSGGRCNNGHLRDGALDAGPVNGFWSGAEWVSCTDGKARPIEPGSFPLAYGSPARVGRLRGYGNAIVRPVATEVIKAYMQTIDERNSK